MKKIILGLVLFICASTNNFALEKSNTKEQVFYCFDPTTKFLQAWTRNEEEIATKILKTQNPDWCGAVFNLEQTQILEIPETVFFKIEKELNDFYEKDKNSFFKENKIKVTREITDKLLNENWEIIMKHREMRFRERALLSETAINKLIEDKKEKSKDKESLEKQKKEAKLKEENSKKQAIEKKKEADKLQIIAKEKQQQEAKLQKQKIEEEKLNKLLANMKPEERRSYICEKTYGFRKGSDKFSECVYKILAADVELEKLELQKKLAEAQLETARANEAAARANAAASASTRNVPAYDPAIGRAAERANEIETARLAFELARQLNPQRYAPQQQNNIQLPKQQYCKLNPINNRISCYTTP
jgi:hypothetical protein